MATAIPIAQPVMAQQAIPVVVGVPIVKAFASVAPMALPAYFKGSGMSPQAWGVLAAAEDFTIRQQVKLFPEYCCGCPPCLAQPNSYIISAGMDKAGLNHGVVLRADEVSHPWSRCCCAPNHALKLEFRQYMPSASEVDPAYNSELGLMAQDVFSDMRDASVFDKGNRLRDVYMRQPVAFTAVRDGTQCCPCAGCFPWMCNKNYGCFACCDCCLDGITVVAGATQEESDVDIGKLDPAQAGIIGHGVVPFLGGHCTPTLHLKKNTSDDTPWAKLQGPMCFGGCSELCCDFKFPISRFEGDDKLGDIAVIKKRRPRGGFAVGRELFTDADVFTIAFKDKSLTPEEKALILGNQLLLDYMFFEKGEQDKCGATDDGKGCYINLCNIFCYGCVCPCKIVCKKQGGD